ncbi:zinc finger MYM-type protein 1-like, partial [Aphis craccivora]
NASTASAKKNCTTKFDAIENICSTPSDSVTKKTKENDSSDDDHDDNSDITSNLDYINTSSDDIDSCESEDAIYEDSDFTLVSTSSSSVKTVKLVPGPKDLSKTLDDGPKQPRLVCYPKTKFGKTMRHFSSKWFDSYNWLEYSVIDNSAFCFPCRFFSKNKDKPIFISIGFKNWKNALDQNSGLKKHHNSEEHKISNTMWVSYSDMKKLNNLSVASFINEGHKKLVIENQNYIKMIGRTLLYTAIQGISQRGDNVEESCANRGNFIELLNLIGDISNEFKSKRNTLPNNTKYTSPQIQNEIFSIFNKMIRNNIIDEFQNCQYFSIIVDETKDITKVEQLSVILRYYLDGIIYERFMGFKAAQLLIASSLFQYIKEILSVNNVDILKCVAQTYDGASVMSGKNHGVQALFRQEVPQAIYVHCYNHRLNLVISDVCKNISTVKMFFDIVENLYVFVSGSAIHSKSVEIQTTMKYRPAVELKSIFLTRWTAQVFACIELKKGLSPLLVLLNKLMFEKGDGAAESKGLLHLIDFDFVFNLIMFCDILQILKTTSDYLQNVKADNAESLILISSIITTFKTMRTDETENNNSKFNEMFTETVNICKENNISIPNEQSKQKRTKKIPEKFKQYIFTVNSSLETNWVSSKNSLRQHVYIPALDYIIKELEARFTDNYGVLSSISYLHPQNEQFLSYEHLKPLAVHYNLDLENLRSELKILPTTIKKYQIHYNVKVKNLMNLIELLEKYKIAFIETYKLSIIIITIPVSSAACERTFSCLRRLKNLYEESYDK